MKTSEFSDQAIKSRPHRRVAPQVDAYETGSALHLYIDLPGVKKEAIQLQYQDQRFEIEANRDYAAEGNLIYGESQSVDYRRVFEVPFAVDGTKIDAELSGGVLRVTLPKAESAKQRQIPVRTA